MGLYLDFAATEPVSQVWMESIIKHNDSGLYGNPDSYHTKGFDAADMIESCTKDILYVLGLNSEYDICYNSGATESINHFIYSQATPTTLFIVDSSSHIALLKAVKKYGDEVFLLQPDKNVEWNINNLHRNVLLELPKDRITRMVLCLTSVNNETGAKCDVEYISKLQQIAKKRGMSEDDFVIFVDDTQGFLKCHFHYNSVDAFCFSAHKIGGFKSFGGLVYKKATIKDRLLLHPFIVGGRNMRGGTQNPLFIAALRDLVFSYKEDSLNTHMKVAGIKAMVLEKLKIIATDYKLKLNINLPSKTTQSSPYILNVSFDGIEGESIMSSLQDAYFSTGSACNSTKLTPSHVLESYKIDKARINCSFRLSFSDSSNHNEIETFMDEEFRPIIKHLARMRTTRTRNTND